MKRREPHWTVRDRPDIPCLESHDRIAEPLRLLGDPNRSKTAIGNLIMALNGEDRESVVNASRLRVIHRVRYQVETIGDERPAVRGVERH